MSTTENLGEFGYCELAIVRDLLDAMLKQGLPDGFDRDGVRPMMNKLSGNVFLTNNEYQVAMLNGDKLELWHSLPYSGDEGFLGDFSRNRDDYNSDDVEYLEQHGFEFE